MRITIVYDNEAQLEGLRPDWGFSCLVEDIDMPTILFDTGARGELLLHNMKRLGVDPGKIGLIVISHAHGDHTGGLAHVLAENEHAEVYVPASVRGSVPGRTLTRVSEPVRLCEKAYSTGELSGIEQSLALETDSGVVVVTGCSHPGVGRILTAAAAFGTVSGLLGGFHGFRDFGQLEDLPLICPCHCTQYKAEIRRRYPEQCLECGAGLVVDL
ncbi:MAG: MBL fold metallo-hydrolase [Chloroflexota bacterium]|nr:MBL fold metallo-hydrolase [Chloroflexota bacterium]